MTNSVTITIQLDGKSAASRSFDLSDDDTAPLPPALSDSNAKTSGLDTMATDAPPPAIETGTASTSSGAEDQPPPDFDGGSSSDGGDPTGSAADGGDTPPPPDV